MLSKDVLRFDLNLVFVEYANRKYAASPISHTLSPCTLLQGQSPACKHHSASLSAAMWGARKSRCVHSSAPATLSQFFHPNACGWGFEHLAVMPVTPRWHTPQVERPSVLHAASRCIRASRRWCQLPKFAVKTI